jgi:hypothetical protein
MKEYKITTNVNKIKELLINAIFISFVVVVNFCSIIYNFCSVSMTLDCKTDADERCKEDTEKLVVGKVVSLWKDIIIYLAEETTGVIP